MPAMTRHQLRRARHALGYTYPEATMSLGLPRIEPSGAVADYGNGLQLGEMGIVQNVITRSLGDVAGAGALIGTAVLSGLLTMGMVGLALGSYQKHGSPWRAGAVAGGFTAVLFLGTAALGRTV